MLMTKRKYDWIITLEGRVLTHDPRPTYCGIEQQEFDEYRQKKGLQTQPVNLMSDDEGFEIYFLNYWQPLKCTELPEPLDFVLFQFAVNCGNVPAVKYLQENLGAIEDGFIGPNTMTALWEAIKRIGLTQICKNLLIQQKDRYIRRYAKLPDKQEELRGLLNRCQYTSDFFGLGVIA